jgi:EAL and modified HD-GYP domain-containing signal transduction protein
VLSYVAKQPILDRKQRVYGYELLFRAGPALNECDAGALLATQQVIAQGVLNIGLANLVGRARAFVNFGREVLLDGWHVELPKESAVIEILETVEPDADVVNACRRLKDQGYTVALDDFVMRPGMERLIDLADLIKVELEALEPAGHAELVRTAHARGIRMVAERVETPEQFEEAKTAGYDYFQGFFFAKPAIVPARHVPAIKANCLRLIQEAGRPELNYPRLESMIKGDVSLAYKLLRYANSALLAHANEIHSLSEAMLYVPEARLRKWIWLAALPALATDKPEELLVLSMARAWMCESIASQAGGASKDEAFLIGLLSLLPALLDQPFEAALAHMNLPQEMMDVLRGEVCGQSRPGQIYRLVRAYESGDWPEVDWLSGVLGLEAAQVTGAYLQALHQANTARF